MKRRTRYILGSVGGAALLCAAAAGVVWAIERSPIIPRPRNTAGWQERQQSISDRLKQGHAQVLWIGDSIVQKWEGPGKPVWDYYYAKRDAVNMGISGDRTEHVLWRLDHSHLESVSPKLAIVMIGQNNDHWNTAGQIAEGVTAIVGQLRQRFPRMKILLLGIFYRGETANREWASLDAANDLISNLQDAGTVYYLNINSIFLSSDGRLSQTLMPDFEHPNEAGCRAWAEAIEPKVAELLGEAPLPPAPLNVLREGAETQVNMAP